MKLSRLLNEIDLKFDFEDVEIDFITDDSRKCKENSVFVAHENAEKYVDEAMKNGAKIVVAERKFCQNCLVVDNTRQTYSKLCRAYFNYPDKKINLIAVTGTNGKTSVATMIHRILCFSGFKTALLGTVYNEIDEDKQDSNLTTADSFELYEMFSKMVNSDTKYCVLEASSQGLDQERLYGLEFEVGIFTNLTVDHLDYHLTFENYMKAKQKLFSQSKVSILNYDDTYYKNMVEASTGEVISYSLKDYEADFIAKNINFLDEQINYALVSDSLIYRIKLNLQGDFFVYNSLAAIVCAYKLGINLDNCANAIKTVTQIKGRFEMLNLDTPYKVIIDYAHTPDGLRQVLNSLKHFCKGKIITVFGCGGDRDRTKRKQMGEIVSKMSDIVVVTSDNPRSEDPMKIIDDILEGVKKPKRQLFIHEDRTKAIEYALKKAKKDDIILLAGKGHEDYQIINDDKFHYDEREIVNQILKSF